MGMGMRQLATILLLALALRAAPATAHDTRQEGFFETREDYRSPGLALSLSITSSALQLGLGAGLFFAFENDTAEIFGLAMGFSGIVSGSSPGQFYAGETLKPIYFGVGRIALAIVAFTEFGSRGFDSNSDDNKVLGPVQIVCVSLAAGLMIWESIDAYFSAKRFNASHHIGEASARWMITPNLIPPASQRENSQPGMGLSFAMGF